MEGFPMRLRHLTIPGAFLLVLGIDISAFSDEATITPAAGGLTERLPPQRVEVGAAPRIIVENRVGSIAIGAGDDGVIEIEAVKRAPTKEGLAELKLAVEKSGDVLTIKGDRDPTSQVNGSLELTIKAPRAASL